MPKRKSRKIECEEFKQRKIREEAGLDNTNFSIDKTIGLSNPYAQTQDFLIELGLKDYKVPTNPEQASIISMNQHIANQCSKNKYKEYWLKADEFPCRLVMFRPPVVDNDTTEKQENIKTSSRIKYEGTNEKSLTREEAYKLMNEHKDKDVYIMLEDIRSPNYLFGSAVMMPYELLIALGVIPVNSITFIFYNYDKEKDMINDFVEMGATLLNDYITDMLDKDKPETNIVIIGSVNASSTRYEWAGELSQEIQDWINLRFYALNILNCCYFGRGAPVGVDLRWQAEELLSNINILADYVKAFSSDKLTLPRMNNIELPKWQEDMLWESRLMTFYSSQPMKKNEKFRETFYFQAAIYQDGRIKEVDKEFKDIKKLMRHAITNYDQGLESETPDIIWANTSAEQAAQLLNQIGIVSSIKAYLSGIQLNDLLT